MPPHHEIADDAAMYFSPQNVEELKNKIIELEKNADFREQLIRKAEVRVQLFSWKKTAEKTLKIYQKVSTDF